MQTIVKRLLIPGLTKHKIDSARKYVIVDRPDQLDDNIPVSSKLQMDKVQYFISFFSRPQFIQDVEFGDIILKLTTGQIIHIPDVLRTLIGSRIISTYLAYCAEVSFEALKRSRLYHILKQCSASQRKSLCGDKEEEKASFTRKKWTVAEEYEIKKKFAGFLAWDKCPGQKVVEKVMA
uniref:Uncharacterized protein n=1 Tax=Magallana gigas TaxID=29159 RepID=A0A8W8MNX9_MAGGI